MLKRNNQCLSGLIAPTVWPRPGRSGAVGFGSVDSDFQILGVILISLVWVLLITESDSVWFLPGSFQIGL